MKKIFFTFFIALLTFFVSQSPVQAAQYPIADLGNCRDAQECAYYCDIPAHAPACWSYGKYVLGKRVLGDTASRSAGMQNLRFPIAELGNCASEQACKQYCTLKENQTACTSYAKKMGLEKSSPQAAKKNQLLEQAKKIIGCTSETSCKALCSKRENYQKCKTLTQALLPSPKKLADDTLHESSHSSLQKRCTTEKECFAYCRAHPKECPGFMQRKQAVPSGTQKMEQRMPRKQGAIQKPHLSIQPSQVQ